MLKPAEAREGDDFCFTWENQAVQFVLGNVRESSGDLTAVVRVNYVNGRVASVFSPSRLNLVAPRSRAEVAKALAGRDPIPGMEAGDWYEAVEYVCGRTYTLWEQGEPFVDLSTVELPAWDKRELFKGFMPRNDPMTLFSDGGVGKSTIAAALCLSALSGREVIPGIPPLDQGPVMYFDWESNAAEHGHRLRTLAHHLGIALPEGFIYRRNFRALSDDLGAMRREASRIRPVLAVVDSAVPASGDDIKETGSARSLFTGLRSLAESMAGLVLAHMSKAEAEKESGRARVMGTVMFENLSRSVWEGRPSEQSGGLHVIGLYHRKFNGGRKRDPFGLQVVYDADELPCGFERIDICDYADLEDRRPSGDRLRDFLSQRKRTTKEVADHLEIDVDKARRMLNRHNDVLQVAGGGGRGNDATWGLRAVTTARPPRTSQIDIEALFGQ